ncbi:MAG TPA: NADP-dependent isocitrate dehydrogenase [Thermoplasmata archaeon]|jgi:isocitrate dehydrogenase
MERITIPIIHGDGIGPEIASAARSSIEAALTKATDGSVSVQWETILAGEASFKATGEWLPKATLEQIKARGVALKGPLTTPVGGGIRSLNVALRQALDLYSSVRPVRYFKGVPSPVKAPEKMNVVIFRENTEDVYRGIEWRRGSQEASDVIEFLRSKFSIEVPPDSGLGLKPMSEYASKRLIRAAVKYALKKKLRSVTLVHKGNIMKFTEGAFRDWGYELAQQEFRGVVVTESGLASAKESISNGKVLMNDRIADNMFQQILTRPEEYSVLAAPNLNGDYLADACAAQIGGLGLAPGANIGDRVAVFEAVHGTAPKYAGKDMANPCSLMLSGAMMLEYLGYADAAETLVGGIAATLAEGIATQDLVRLGNDLKSVGTKRFADEVIRRLD